MSAWSECLLSDAALRRPSIAALQRNYRQALDDGYISLTTHGYDIAMRVADPVKPNYADPWRSAGQ